MRVPYTPPSWAKHLIAPQHGRVRLAHLPTPVLPWACNELAALDVEWWIKRDDMSGVELSGNKARKLEFLMAEAVEKGCDCVVTIGGAQSNHCRATAAAARLVGLEPHLVLVVRDRDLDKEMGLAGNLLLDRLLGAQLHVCAASDYLRQGGDLKAMDSINAVAAGALKAQGRRPYVVPVGGTTPLGTWGYLAAVHELQQQQATPAAEGAPPPPPAFDHVVVAAGSGGTAAGLALGCRLAGLGAQLHAVNVQHAPDAYFDLIDTEAQELGATAADGCAREWLQIHNGGGLGYGVASREELDMIARVGASSGVVLDHVYTGKALFHFVEHARAQPDAFRGKRVLFWHTGGLPGLQAKEDVETAKEAEMLARVRPVQRLELPC